MQKLCAGAGEASRNRHSLNTAILQVETRPLLFRRLQSTNTLESIDIGMGRASMRKSFTSRVEDRPLPLANASQSSKHRLAVDFLLLRGDLVE